MMKNKLDRINKKLTLQKNSNNTSENIVIGTIQNDTHREKKAPLPQQEWK